MGFDINITLVLQMCEETGKPFYYKHSKKEGFVQVFEMPNIDVPKSLRKYLRGRGHLFHAYTDIFNDQEIFETHVERFLEEFPSWEQVMSYEAYRDDIPEFWNEDDHNNFKKLLEWCSVQDCSFRISWSY